MRTFDTGATRNSDKSKFDYEGFLSPLVLRRYAGYMHAHRRQADGKMRDSDNWQKGMPFSAYMKSLWRHLMDLWMGHRYSLGDVSKEEALCAIIFNASGYLHELIVAQMTGAAVAKEIHATGSTETEDLRDLVRQPKPQKFKTMPLPKYPGGTSIDGGESVDGDFGKHVDKKVSFATTKN